MRRQLYEWWTRISFPSWIELKWNRDENKYRLESLRTYWLKKMGEMVFNRWLRCDLEQHKRVARHLLMLWLRTRAQCLLPYKLPAARVSSNVLCKRSRCKTRITACCKTISIFFGLWHWPIESTALHRKQQISRKCARIKQMLEHAMQHTVLSCYVLCWAQAHWIALKTHWQVKSKTIYCLEAICVNFLSLSCNR